MSKVKSKKLYSLIHALTSSERRYVKLFNKESAFDNQYMRLFGYIEQQTEEYDEAAVILSMYGPSKIESRKFSELKRYLYDFIVRALQQYDLPNSALQLISEQLIRLRSLYKRGQYEAALELLERTKQQAIHFDDVLSQIECLRWERQVAYAQMDVDFFDRALDRLDEEERLLLRKLENLTSYRNLFYKLYINIRTNAFARNEIKILALQQIIDSPLMQHPDMALSYTAQIVYFRILNLYHYSSLEMDKFNASGRHLLDLMDQQPHIFIEDPTEYISALSNYTMSCGLTQNYEEVRRCLVKLKEVRTRTLDDKVKIHMLYYSYFFSLCIYTGEFLEGKAVLEVHFDENSKFENIAVFERGSLYFYYCYIYLGCGDYESALDWLNKWLSLPRSLERQDLQSLARIINLIIHYEMGNSQLLESLVRSTQRYLQKHESLLEFERLVLNFVKEAPRLRDRKAWIAAFQQLKSQLEDLREKPAESAMLRYFDIIAWLESKIINRPFSEVVRDRYINRN